MRAAGDFAVVTDADAGLLVPDVGSPRTVGSGSEDGTFFGEGLLVGDVGCLAEFAVDFVLVGVGHELVEEGVDPDQFHEVVGGQEGNQAFLPVVMTAFDFTFGLGLWGAAELDAVKVERCPKLGESGGVVGGEEGVLVQIQGQGQAVGWEGAGEKIEMGQKGFAGVKPCDGFEAGGVVGDWYPGNFRTCMMAGFGATCR